MASKGVTGVPDGKKHKKDEGNKYVQNEEFAEEVLAKNVARPAQNNPKFNARKPF